MNLVAITALIAVCGAAKLDRTYLPPASAPTAGGSPGALQTPFTASRSSFNGNNGLGGIPKGSYENEFQGVVVDAAAAGTRASGVEASGLGAPRISYGSTDSRVGAAAFKTRPSAFAQPQNDESGFQQSQGQFAGQVSGSQGFQGSATQGFQSAAQGSSQGQFSAGAQGEERPRAAIDRAAGILRYENEVGPEGYHYAFETDNGITAEENGVASNGVQAQGGFSYTGDDGQVYSVSYMADEGGYRPKGDHLPTPPPIPVEILKSLEQNARDEAAGLSDDGSYDAQKYNAGSDYSESDGANGKIHQSSRFGGESDATASGTFISQSNQPFGRPGQRGQSGQKGQVGQFGQLGQKGQVTQFGQSTSNAQSDDTSGADEQSTDLGATDASGQGANGQSGSGFSGQFGQSSNRGSSATRGAGRFGQSSAQGQATIGSSNSNVDGANGNEQSGSNFSGQFGQSNRFQSSNRGSQSGRFGQTGSSSQGQANRFGSNASSQTGINGLGNREYLPPVNKPSQNVRPQNGRPANGRPQVANKAPETSQDTEEPKKDDEASADFVPLAQQDLQSESRPQGAFTSFGKPITTQNGFDPSEKKPTNGRRPSANGNNNFAQSQSSQSGNRFGEPNAYLPPGSNGNRRPGQNGFQSNTASHFNQQTQRPQTSFASGSQSAFATQSQSGLGSETQPTFASQPQQTNGFQRPQFSRPGQLGNRFGSADQSGSSFGFNKPVKATAQPDTELTTPFETSNDETSASQSAQSTTSGLSSASRPTSGRPAQPSFGGQFNNAQSSFGSQSSSRPQGTTSRPFGQPSAFPTQPPNQFNQNSQFGSQSQSSFGQNSDAQFASSTQRPTYTQQPQGPDNSYYYNQPSEPFGTPQGSRFPSAPSNQFTGVNQQTSFSQSQFSGSSEDEPAASNLPSSLTQGSSKYPQPPTIAPVVGGQSQFAGQFQGSSKYPRPPTVQTPTGPSSSQALFQGNGVNGVTQASISSFPTQTPIQTSQFENRFGSRPSFQQSQTSQFEQSQTSQSSSSRPTQPSFGQQSTSSFSQSNNFQGQAQSFGQQTQEDEAGADKPEQPVATQQYNGEIYEYNKPAQTLPPPESTPAPSSGSFAQKVQGQGQFGAQSSRPQFGQTNDEEDQRPISQFGGQASTAVSKPQFGVSRPQSGQNSFGAEPSQTPEDSKPYGALAQRFGQPSASRPQFGGQTGPQFGQTQTSFEANTDDETQKESSQSDTQASCCKTLPSFDRNPQGQNQFSQNFPGAQTFKPEPTSSFANKGEHFGGPRPPPSFDEETGYHY